LRQTVETPTQSPLLWYTDTGYVDFGDFSQAVRRGAEPKTITVEVEIELGASARAFGKRLLQDLVRLAITLHEQGGRTQVSECVVTCNEDSCRLGFDGSGNLTTFVVNGLDVLAMTPTWRAMGDDTHLVPYFSGDLPPNAPPGVSLDGPPVVEHLLAELQPLMDAKTSPAEAKRLVNALGYGSGTQIKEDLLGLQPSAEWKRNIDSMDLSGDQFRRIRALLLGLYTPWILQFSRFALDRYAKGVKYLGPFRAAPERFYRQQSIAVQQIEPHGENLAMFLRALPDREFEDLSRFVHEHLGFGIRMVAEGSHVSILIKEDNGEAFNLTDMGYGFSQVLPVVVQAWATARGFRSSEREVPTTLLAAEQPELHLHPHHQERLADMLAGVVKASRAASEVRGSGDAEEASGVQILVETHSEALVNRLGELVEAGQLAAADVSVLLFEKDPRSGITRLTCAPVWHELCRRIFSWGCSYERIRA
jgi:hypothetical protein